jgi:hypothetical protein
VENKRQRSSPARAERDNTVSSACQHQNRRPAGNRIRKSLAIEEAYRPITIREQDWVERGPVIQAILRKVAVAAAKKSGRLARLIEYDPAYCDVILRRFEAATGTSAILARTGQTFEDVAAACSQSETSHYRGQDRSWTIESGEEVR